jgi:hypothetical protein
MFIPWSRTDEWFFSGVQPLMSLQLTRLGEGPGAAGIVAQVWPLSGVSSQVSLFTEEEDLFYNLRQTGIILLLKFIFGG